MGKGNITKEMSVLYVGLLNFSFTEDTIQYLFLLTKPTVSRFYIASVMTPVYIIVKRGPVVSNELGSKGKLNPSSLRIIL